jgi:small subunit ribosomal protein S1
MSWTKKVAHPSEMVKKGDVLQCVVLSVDKEKKRIALGRKQLFNDPWLEEIPSNYHVGDLLTGFVTKITTFGAFVKLDENLEGLLHISEITDDREARPEDVIQAGLKVEVRVIRVDIEDRKIGLSLVHSDFEENAAVLAKAASEPAPATAEEALTAEEAATAEDAAPAEEAPAAAEAEVEAAGDSDAPAEA